MMISIESTNQMMDKRRHREHRIKPRANVGKNTCMRPHSEKWRHRLLFKQRYITIVLIVVMEERREQTHTKYTHTPKHWMEKQLNRMQDFYDSCHEWRMNDSFMDSMRFTLKWGENECKSRNSTRKNANYEGPRRERGAEHGEKDAKRIERERSEWLSFGASNDNERQHARYMAWIAIKIEQRSMSVNVFCVPVQRSASIIW